MTRECSTNTRKNQGASERATATTQAAGADRLRRGQLPQCAPRLTSVRRGAVQPLWRPATGRVLRLWRTERYRLKGMIVHHTQHAWHDRPAASAAAHRPRAARRHSVAVLLGPDSRQEAWHLRVPPRAHHSGGADWRASAPPRARAGTVAAPRHHPFRRLAECRARGRAATCLMRQLVFFRRLANDECWLLLYTPRRREHSTGRTRFLFGLGFDSALWTTKPNRVGPGPRGGFTAMGDWAHPARDLERATLRRHARGAE